MFNNKELEISDNSSLLETLQMQQLADKKGIAVAVNSSVVSRKDWAGFTLKNNDNVLVIKAVQGG